MKCRMICLLIVLSMLLGGCGWMDGYHFSVTPHREHSSEGRGEDVSVSNYLELRTALENMILSGRETGTIRVADYNQGLVETSMVRAVRYARETFPVGAYAVEDISYEIGAGGGKPAVAVEITYLRSRTDIQKISRVKDMDAAWELITKELGRHSAGVVLLVEDYVPRDMEQLIEDYAQQYPDRVMETPQVHMGTYPENGESRVVELKLTYQNSRDTLRQMQEQVQPLFTSAGMYVSVDTADYVKFSQLYAFLMERFDYKLDASITPAYSLLRHGVGDSRAFATVYAAMCRRAGLECSTVTGTRAGEAWYWNIIQDNGKYFHVDLLRCSESGGFQEFLDGDMAGYVWDYSAYPACDAAHAVPEETESTEPAEDTAPEETEPTEPTEDTAPEGTEGTLDDPSGGAEE